MRRPRGEVSERVQGNKVKCRHILEAMDPINLELFLGIPLDFSRNEALCLAWAALPAHKKGLLFPPTSDAPLLEVSLRGIPYLSKSLGHSVDPATLEQLEAHIHSVLRRLLPDSSLPLPPVLLFAKASQ